MEFSGAQKTSKLLGLLSFACCNLFLFPNVLAEEAVDAVKGQIPTDQEAIEARAAFLKENVPAAPLPAGSPNLDSLRARVANLQQKQAAYLQDLAAGKTTPFPEIRENWPQYQSTIKVLETDLQSLAAEKDPVKRAQLSKALFAALQPIGFLLEDADYVEAYENVLSPAQVAELARLEKAWEQARKQAFGAKPNKEAALVPLGPGPIYTLTFLRVPLSVKAPPHASVFFRAEAGGLFSNDLPLIEIKADEAGLATAHWVTKGDAIARAWVEVASPQASSEEGFNIRTVKLSLLPIPVP